MTAEKRTVHLTLRGHDVTGPKADGHVRLEDGEIFVDVFDSAIPPPEDGHLETETFPNTKEGRVEATEFLRGYGINFRVVK